MFGLPVSKQVTVRYIGVFLATGAYVSNWAALNAFQANNVVGQWKRAATAAAITACNGLGGVAGSYIVRQQEAPQYLTAVWVSVGYVSPCNRLFVWLANIGARSHILLIAIVAAFSLYFYVANRQQSKGTKIIEGVVCSATFLYRVQLIRNIARVQVYLLTETIVVYHGRTLTSRYALTTLRKD